MQSSCSEDVNLWTKCLGQTENRDVKTKNNNAGFSNKTDEEKGKDYFVISGII